MLTEIKDDKCYNCPCLGCENENCKIKCTDENKKFCKTRIITCNKRIPPEETS